MELNIISTTSISLSSLTTMSFQDWPLRPVCSRHSKFLIKLTEQIWTIIPIVSIFLFLLVRRMSTLISYLMLATTSVYRPFSVLATQDTIGSPSPSATRFLLILNKHLKNNKIVRFPPKESHFFVLKKKIIG